MKSGPHLPQLEKALAQKQRLNIAINQSINQLKKKKEKLRNGRLYGALRRSYSILGIQRPHICARPGIHPQEIPEKVHISQSG